MLGKQAKADLPKALFSEPFHEALVHEAARADLAARRRGTHSSLTRGEVSMTGAKAWRQKGTGRARVGALGVPHRYGGGAAFGPKPRHYTFKVNRKARRKAMRAALSVHAERDSVAVFDASGYAEPSTKTAAKALDNWGGDRRSWSCWATRRPAPPRASATSGRSRRPGGRRRCRRRDRLGLAAALRGGPRGAEGEGGLMDPRQVIIRPSSPRRATR